MAYDTLTNEQKRTWGMLCHLAAFLEFIGLPLGNIFGPLIVWMIFRDRSPFIDDQGREALNFQLSFLIYGAILAVLVTVTLVITMTTMGLGFLALLPVLVSLGVLYYVMRIVLVILASVAAANGKNYRYPLTIRFL